MEGRGVDDTPTPHPAAPAWQEPTPRDVALKGLCPRCGSKTLFAGSLRFADRCSVCGLDIAGFNVGDGPAAFLTLILGTIVVGLAVWVQVALAPPWWVHLLLWVPLTFASVIGSLRITKGALIALEYRNAAAEGRFR